MTNDIRLQRYGILDLRNSKTANVHEKQTGWVDAIIGFIVIASLFANIIFYEMAFNEKPCTAIDQHKIICE